MYKDKIVFESRGLNPAGKRKGTNIDAGVLHGVDADHTDRPAGRPAAVQLTKKTPLSVPVHHVVFI